MVSFFWSGIALLVVDGQLFEFWGLMYRGGGGGGVCEYRSILFTNVSKTCVLIIY